LEGLCSTHGNLHLDETALGMGRIGTRNCYQIHFRPLGLRLLDEGDGYISTSAQNLRKADRTPRRRTSARSPNWRKKFNLYCLQMLVSPQEELQMPSSVGLSTCPKCQAIYHVLKVEGGPDAKATCRVCGAPLPTPQGLEDKFVLKYFLMREGPVTSLE
jgi:hypothetical protein